MEISYANILQHQTAAKTISDQTAPLSSAFVNTLNNVISKDLSKVVIANEHSENAAFLKKKGEIEFKPVNSEEDDEKEESIYKTVKEIEKRLVALARLERKVTAGF